MTPWYWIWTSQAQRPPSRSVAQDNGLGLNWHFGTIRPEAGLDINRTPPAHLIR